MPSEKLKRFAFLVGICLIIEGCTSYRFIQLSEVDGPKVELPVKAVILNPELREETLILERSQLYTLTTEPTTPTKIQLKPLERMPSCGNPLLGPILTLGILPARVGDRYGFTFTEKKEEKIIDRKAQMLIEMRVWILDLFLPKNELNSVAQGVSEAFRPK